MKAGESTTLSLEFHDAGWHERLSRVLGAAQDE
jgi:hypothetical protein